MKTIKERFQEKEIEYPNLSTYIVFAKAISKQGYDPKEISSSFSKLVDKNDYDKKDKICLLKQLEILSKKPVKSPQKDSKKA
jgi:hypothetical protein